MKLTKQKLENYRKKFKLSPRELDILDLLFQGINKNSDIADKLDITEGTVKQYFHMLYVKLDRPTKIEVLQLLWEDFYSQSIYKQRDKKQSD